MKKLVHMFRATIVGGMLFIVPFVLLVLVIGKALELLRAIVNPIAEKLPFEFMIGLETPSLLSIFLLLLLSFAAGLFARTSIAKSVVNWLETTLLSDLPGYSFMKNMGDEAAETGPTQQYQSVLARFDDAWQIGFLVERLEGGRVVVFIPGSPSPWSGSVFIFDEDRITLIDEATNASIKVLKKMGAGTSGLVEGKFNSTQP